MVKVIKTIRQKKMFLKELILSFLMLILLVDNLNGQTAMINFQSRNLVSLNGEWNVIIDPTRDR